MEKVHSKVEHFAEPICLMVTGVNASPQRHQHNIWGQPDVVAFDWYSVLVARFYSS